MLSLQEEPIEQSLASEVILEDVGSRFKQPHTDVNPVLSAELLSTNSFITAGLHIDAFDFGETSEWMLDDFWFLNEALDVDAHAHQLF